MTNASMRLLLTTTAAVCLLLAWPHRSQAFEQEPRAVTDNTVDPRKLSEANKAAEVNQVVPQSNVPGFGTEKTVTGQGGDQHGPDQKIPGVDFSSSGNNPGTGTRLGGPKDVPGFENAGAVGVNLPGSSYQHSPDDINKVIGNMSQQAREFIDKAMQGGVNALNTSAGSTPGETVSDKTDGKNNNKSNSVSIGPNTFGSTGTYKGPDGSMNTTSTWQEGKTLYQMTTTVKDGFTTITLTTKKDGKTETVTSGPILQGTDQTKKDTATSSTPAPAPKKDPNKKDGTPSDDGSTSVSSNTPLSPNSAIAKKNYGGGTGNNSETSSGPVGPLAPGSSFARKGYGDGSGGDAGDNNNHTKVGGLSSGTSFARRGYGDGSDSRGSSGGNSKVTGKPKRTGGGNGELAATKSSTVIGAGLLEGDSGFSAQGPAAAGVAASGPITSRAAVTGRILGR